MIFVGPGDVGRSRLCSGDDVENPPSSWDNVLATWEGGIGGVAGGEVIDKWCGRNDWDDESDALGFVGEWTGLIAVAPSSIVFFALVCYLFSRNSLSSSTFGFAWNGKQDRGSFVLEGAGKKLAQVLISSSLFLRFINVKTSLSWPIQSRSNFHAFCHIFAKKFAGFATQIFFWYFGYLNTFIYNNLLLLYYFISHYNFVN